MNINISMKTDMRCYTIKLNVLARNWTYIHFSAEHRANERMDVQVEGEEEVSLGLRSSGNKKFSEGNCGNFHLARGYE